MPAGKVATLPPSQDLLYHHHGNGKAGIALSEDNSGSCGVGVPGAAAKVFNNPWPSYRMATLSDAMLSYQRGAAIAIPQLPEPVPSRTPSRTLSRSQTGTLSRSGSRANAFNSGNSRPTSRTASRSESRAGPVETLDSQLRNSTNGNGGSNSQLLVNLLSSPPRNPRELGHNRSASVATVRSTGSNDSSSTVDRSAKVPLIKTHSRSISDTTLLYHPEPRSPSWLKPDDPDDAADEDDEESIEGYDDDTWSFQHPPGQSVKGYVRPSFSRIMTFDDEDDWREPPIRVERPRWSKSGDAPLVTWLGHAGALIQIPWTNTKGGIASRTPYCGVIFDPIFSYRCSPSQLVGPARHLDPPCRVAELPAIHACCISHDHYDHLDYQTIVDLWMLHMATIHFFVPLGLASWFTACGIPEQRVTELDWWHEAILSFPDISDECDTESVDFETLPPGYPPETTSEPARIDPSAALTLKLAFTPAQHRSGRGLFDHMTSLWGSWCVGVVGPGREVDAVRPGMAGWEDFKVYFGGDTGYRYATAEETDATAVCPAFGEIADRYAPFTLSMLPLSTGSSLPFLRSLLSLSLDQYTLTSSLHCSPADSLDIHLTLRAKRSLGVHWGTFCDAAEARATRVEFGRARREKGVSNDWEQSGDKGAFVVADIGLVMEIL